jgi:hypothetical protein
MDSIDDVLNAKFNEKQNEYLTKYNFDLDNEPNGSNASTSFSNQSSFIMSPVKKPLELPTVRSNLSTPKKGVPRTPEGGIEQELRTPERVATIKRQDNPRTSDLFTVRMSDASTMITTPSNFNMKQSMIDSIKRKSILSRDSNIFGLPG